MLVKRTQLFTELLSTGGGVQTERTSGIQRLVSRVAHVEREVGGGAVQPLPQQMEAGGGLNASGA